MITWMPSDDDYIREAEDARRWAARAKTEEARTVWLRIAQKWLGLVRGRPLEKQLPKEHSAQQRQSSAEDTH